MTKKRFGQMGAALAVGALIVMAPAAVAAGQDGVLEGDVEAGAELYAAQCKGCHTVSIAPTLRGVAERRIASVTDFGGYSPGLKAKGAETWTAANLDAFLTAPPVFAPGTRMVMSVSDGQARADIIAYIRTLPPKR